MKGTPEQITAKKAARIRSNVRQFFRYYRNQLEQTGKPALKEFNRAELQALETVQVLNPSHGHRVAAFPRSPTAESMESYADRNSSADSGDIPPAAVSTRITVSSRSPASDTLYIMSYT